MVKRSEQLNNKITRLEEQLREAKKEARKQARLEQKLQEQKEYQEKVAEALSLVELAKKIQITVNDNVITIYDYLKQKQ